MHPTESRERVPGRSGGSATEVAMDRQILAQAQELPAASRLRTSLSASTGAGRAFGAVLPAG